MTDERDAVSYNDVFTAFPNVPLTWDNVDIYEQRLHRRLCVKRCRECALLHQPPRSYCPHCLSPRLELTEVSGRGEVALFTRLHTGAPAEGIDYVTGHPVVFVELREQAGLRLTGQFVTPDGRDATIGEPVELVWIVRNGQPVPAFAPTADRSGHGSTNR